MAAARVLHLDDEEGFIRDYGDFLRLKGFAVDGAQTLSEALNLADRKTYHVALIDIILDRQDAANREGLKLVMRLNELDEGTVPVVASRTEDTQLSADVVQRYGAKRFLAKYAVEQEGLRVLYDAIARASEECTLHPFGVAENRSTGKLENKSAIDYILNFEQTSAHWMDSCLHLLRPKGGYGALRDFLNAFLTPWSPLLPLRGAREYLAIDQSQPLLTGDFWSKAIGEAVSLVVCRVDMVDTLLAGTVRPAWILATEVTLSERRQTKGDLVGVAFKFSQDRTAFTDRLPPTKDRRFVLPDV